MGLFEKKEESNHSDLSPDKTGSLSLEELEAKRNQRLGIVEKTEKRGRKGKSENIQDELVKDLYKPSVWSEVGCFPFTIRKAMTGDEIFDLSKEQKESLGAPLALIMKMLVEIDPKYLALTVFFINLGTIWAEKELIYSMKKAKVKNAKTGA